MRTTIFCGLTLILGVCALPGSAAAVPVSCPGDGSGSTVYTADGTGDTTVVSCVFEADGNLNGDFTAPSSDAFLDGPGDSATIVDGGTYFGGGWTSFCSSDGGGCTTDYGFVYDAVNGDADGSTFSFTGATGSEYALGIKDGSDPAWAVFLLSSTSNSYSGTWNIFKSGTDQAADALSHFAIYDRTIPTTSTTTTPSTTTTTTPTSTPSGVAPEPTVMTLLGAGLVLAGRRFRRRNNA